MDQLDLDELRSNKAVEIFLGFVKEKLPEHLRGMVDQVLDGDTGSSGAAGALESLKGLLGGY